MTIEQIKKLRREIDEMSHYGMAHLWRHAPSGHPYFNKELPLFGHFEKRFRELGGMTTAISKAIGQG